MKRWLLRIILCLILGAITTVAVSWGCVIVMGPIGEQWNPYHNPYQIDPLVIFITRRGGTEVISGCGRSGTLLGRHGAEVAHVDNTPWWRAHEVSWHDDFTIAAGFPILAVGSAIHTDWVEDAPGQFKSVRYSHSGIMLPAFAVRGTIPESDTGRVFAPVLPLRPIWPGFVIDTLFYAAIWLGLFFGFASAKRAIRQKRGRCPRCGYDLRGDLAAGCSECGWGREEREP